MEAVKNDGSTLTFAGNKIKDNKEIVVEAVRNNSSSFKYASPNLQGDKEIALLSLKDSASNLKYVSEELKNDKKFILEALMENTKVYSYLPEKQKENTLSSKELIEKIIKEEYKINLFNHEYKAQENTLTNKSEKEPIKDNPWTDKVNSDKDNQWER